MEKRVARSRILVTILMDDEMREALRELSIQDHKSQSELVRDWIKAHARDMVERLRKSKKPVPEALDL
jgi:predicted DNA-binding protein